MPPNPLDDIAARHESERPQTTDEARARMDDEQAQADEAVAAQAVQANRDGLRDKLGRPFDASLHEVNPDGSPAVSARNARLLKIRKGVKRHQSAGGGSRGAGSHVAPPGGPAQGESAPASQAQSTRAAAVATVGGVQALGMMVGGEEWKYRKDEKLGIDEESAGIEAFRDYFEARGITDIPPGVVICIWAFSYAVPRFTMPKTQTRTKRAMGWLVTKWRKARGARAYSGDDGKRENDTSNGTVKKT